MSLIRLLARPMLASAFVADGVDAVMHPERHAEKFDRIRPTLEKAGVPPVVAADTKLLARATGAVSALAGVGLALGRKPRTAALVLAAINLPIAIVRDPIWAAENREERKEMTSNLLRSASMIGGVLVAALDRKGKPSMAWRYHHWKDNRTELSEVKAQAKDELRLARLQAKEDLRDVKAKLKEKYSD